MSDYLSKSRGSVRSSSPAKERDTQKGLILSDEDDDVISDIDLDTPHSSFKSSPRSLEHSSHLSPRRKNHQEKQSLGRFHDSTTTSTSSPRARRNERTKIRLESDLQEKQREIATLG